MVSSLANRSGRRSPRRGCSGDVAASSDEARSTCIADGVRTVTTRADTAPCAVGVSLGAADTTDADVIADADTIGVDFIAGAHGLDGDPRPPRSRPHQCAR